MPSQAPAIVINYDAILDRPDSDLIFDIFKEMKQNGASIFVAMGPDKDSTQKYQTEIKNRNYQENIFGYNTNEYFKSTQKAHRYWNDFCWQFSREIEDILFVDSNTNAQQVGINTVYASTDMPTENIIKHIQAEFNKMKPILV